MLRAHNGEIDTQATKFKCVLHARIMLCVPKLSSPTIQRVACRAVFSFPLLPLPFHAWPRRKPQPSAKDTGPAYLMGRVQ